MVRFFLPGGLTPRSGFTRDVSSTGLFIMSTSVPPAGTVLKLSLRAPNGRDLELTGIVIREVRIDPALRQLRPPGFAVCFERALAPGFLDPSHENCH